MSKPTLVCHVCKESFLREQMVQYCSNKAKILYWYCPKCLEEKQAKERFSDQVCKIFGLKSPGPRIWAERKRLVDKYGYSDQILIDCLDYIYNVEHTKKLAESLCLINPVIVDKMMRYKHQKDEIGTSLAQAIKTEVHEYVAPVRQPKAQKKQKLNPDDFLDD